MTEALDDHLDRIFNDTPVAAVLPAPSTLSSDETATGTVPPSDRGGSG